MKFTIYLFNRIFLARNLSDFSNNLDVILQLHLQALCKCQLRVCHNRKTKLLGQLERKTYKHFQFLKKQIVNGATWWPILPKQPSSLWNGRRNVSYILDFLITNNKLGNDRWHISVLINNIRLRQKHFFRSRFFFLWPEGSTSATLLHFRINLAIGIIKYLKTLDRSLTRASRNFPWGSQLFFVFLTFINRKLTLDPRDFSFAVSGFEFYRPAAREKTCDTQGTEN